MNSRKMIFLALFFTLFISGCSSVSEDSNKAEGTVGEIDSTTSEAKNSIQQPELATEENSEQVVVEDKETNQSIDTNSTEDRMVIYSANLTIRVVSFKDTLKLVKQQLTSANGYIVESNSYSTGDGESLEGMITVRIPQGTFDSFLQSVEKESTKVVDRSITGQDVTEEFVDLESRLKSKQVVENRLLDFMEKAEKTEDLLKISTDLATVQGEIEQIKGRMNYLNNKIDMATVTIHVIEDKVKVPQLENNELNTWEKTKQQFMNSVNFLLKICSALFVFIVGSLPIIIVLGLLLFLFLIIRRIRRKKPPTNPKE
ncbi:DUF4349 domain-containing protein [Metabacillus sediminilitoris]|uniref:DUF4349 domain-containing protein n=1 Tax=Metabacillus sediminilitoris TaxID=2567941 RepID=A0A4S4C5S4_9BACI|nr:DUF4349 domain-containing protein [Metabacillus sediminilitoris]QGQ47030.1 DUF4349 domain-containing protein [Metabacillus sediminilitoris]THF83176.1 DUF4349 domain-containing protein [Metabacillus sediminilitoris]